MTDQGNTPNAPITDGTRTSVGNDIREYIFPPIAVTDAMHMTVMIRYTCMFTCPCDSASYNILHFSCMPQW